MVKNTWENVKYLQGSAVLTFLNLVQVCSNPLNQTPDTVHSVSYVPSFFISFFSKKYILQCTLPFKRLVRVFFFKKKDVYYVTNDFCFK